MNNKKIAIVGAVHMAGASPVVAALEHAKNIAAAHSPRGMVIKTAKDLKRAAKMTEQFVPSPPEFETEAELNKFLEDTKHIPINKVPKMPFKMLRDYVEEYSLISKKKSNLTGTQRIHVKNIVHYNLRKGTIRIN